MVVGDIIENKFTRTRAHLQSEKNCVRFFTDFSADARSMQNHLGAQILSLGGTTWHELQRPMLPLFIYLCAWWQHL